jgi:hypothetical protein
MKTKNETELLEELLIQLENKQKLELIILREQFRTTLEGFKPLNLIKGAWHEVSDSADVRSDLVGSVIGLATGYVTKKLVLGGTHNPFKKVIGTVLQFAIANLVAKKGETIRSKGEMFLKSIFAKRKEKKEEEVDSMY